MTATIAEGVLRAISYSSIGAFETFAKALYFSLVTYTTLGYGDLVLQDEHRLMGAIEVSQNIHNCWQLGTLQEKKKLQKLVFPEGVVVDTKKRTYLTSRVNSLFLAKSRFIRDSEGANKRLPIKF